MVRPLAGDASGRCYFRLQERGGSTAVLARYPAEPVVFARDLEVLSWLLERGLRVPRVLAADPARLEVILEDLGSRGAAEVLAESPVERRLPLASRLLGPLATLARLDAGALPSWNPPLGRRRLRWELAGFELWYVRDRSDRSPPAWLGRFLDSLAAAVAAHPVRVCHRDYHVDNLFLLADGGVGVIDAQDILVGPDTYDLASLVGERALPELLSEQECAVLARSWASLCEAEPGWEQRLQETHLQRGLKVLGTFARLERSGRSGYGRFIAPLTRRLAVVAEEVGAPSSLVQFLLDSSSWGGADVR